MTHTVALPVSYVLTLMGLGVLGLSVVFAILYRFGIFKRLGGYPSPTARGLFFNGMQDAILIVDHQGRLLDFNPAAKDLLPELDHAHIGRQATEVCAGVPILGESLISALPCEITLGADSAAQHFEMRTVPLLSGKHNLGHAAIFTNITAQAHLRDQLRFQAETDTLTGIANRRRFTEVLQRECMRYNRYQGIFTLMMLDIDHFKYVNDHYGHPVGDAVLRAIVDRLQTCLREQDLLARYGGEEFSVLLVQTGRDAALVAAERIRNVIASEPFLIDGISMPLTMSIGLITQGGEWASESYLFKHADIALYKAKSLGRNRVMAAENANLPYPIGGNSVSRKAVRNPSIRRPAALNFS